MSKHTPGPWEVNHGKAHVSGKVEFFVLATFADPEVALCSEVIDPYTGEPSEANATLIAAAPDLLEALGDLYDHAFCPCQDPDCGSNKEPAMLKALAAIKKAGG